MVNECLMYLRQTIHFNLTCSFNEKDYYPDVSFKAGADTHFSMEAIYRSVREQPIGYRTVFNLYEIEGYSHKEITDRYKLFLNFFVEFGLGVKALQKSTGNKMLQKITIGYLMQSLGEYFNKILLRFRIPTFC